jgi:hypothetical protein
MARPDGAYSYEMEIIVPADSPIKTPADIAGHGIRRRRRSLLRRAHRAV